MIVWYNIHMNNKQYHPRGGLHIKKQRPLSEQYKCRACKLYYPRDVYFDDQGKKHSNCPDCRTKERALKPRLDPKAIKLSLINGCICRRCGYSEFVSALCFHHLDPSIKDAGVSTFISRYCTTPTDANYQLIVDEILKCIILCANCHNALHAGDWEL
jgi:hypothetical protein